MKIYSLERDSDNFYSLKPVKEKYDDKEKMNGDMKYSWEIYDVKRDVSPRKKKVPIGDYTAIAVTPVLAKTAVDLLFDESREGIQLLPIHCIENDIIYYILNVVAVIDAIDYEKAEPVLFSSGRVMRFEKYAFHEEKLKGIKIFKIPEKLHSWPFVTDEIVDKIEQFHLTGFNPKLVWDSKKND